MTIRDGAILLLGEADSGGRQALDRIEAEPPAGYETLRADAAEDASREALEDRYRLAVGASRSEDLDAILGSSAAPQRWLLLLDASDGLQPEVAQAAAHWVERSDGRVRVVAAVPPGPALDTALETLAPTGPPIRLSLSGPDAAAAKVRRLLGVSGGARGGAAVVTTAELTRARRASAPPLDPPMAPIRRFEPTPGKQTPVPIETDPLPGETDPRRPASPAATEPDPAPNVAAPPSAPTSHPDAPARPTDEPAFSLLSWSRERIRARHALGLAAVVAVVLSFFGWGTTRGPLVRTSAPTIVTAPSQTEPRREPIPEPAAELAANATPDAASAAQAEADVGPPEREEEIAAASDAGAGPPAEDEAAAEHGPALAPVASAAPELTSESATGLPAGLGDPLEPDEVLPPIVRDPARVPAIVRIGPPSEPVTRADSASRAIEASPRAEPTPPHSAVDAGPAPVAVSPAPPESPEPAPDELAAGATSPSIVHVTAAQEPPGDIGPPTRSEIDVAAPREPIESGAPRIAAERRPDIVRIGTPETVSVAFDATPAARILIDGAPAGTTPLPRVPLLPGVHRVRIEFVDGGVAEESVRVERERRSFLFRRSP